MERCFPEDLEEGRGGSQQLPTRWVTVTQIKSAGAKIICEDSRHLQMNWCHLSVPLITFPKNSVVWLWSDFDWKDRGRGLLKKATFQWLPLLGTWSSDALLVRGKERWGSLHSVHTIQDTKQNTCINMKTSYSWNKNDTQPIHIRITFPPLYIFFSLTCQALWHRDYSVPHLQAVSSMLLLVFFVSKCPVKV